jgi:hypothetical protein
MKKNRYQSVISHGWPTIYWLMVNKMWYMYRIQYYWNKRSGPLLDINGFFFCMITQVKAEVHSTKAVTWVLMRKKKPVISNTGKFFRVCELLKCILATQKQLTNRSQVITNQTDHRWRFGTLERPCNI